MPKPPSNQQRRDFLKYPGRGLLGRIWTGGSRGVPPPPVENLFAADQKRIDLCPPGQWQHVHGELEAAVAHRQSFRHDTDAPLLLCETIRVGTCAVAVYDQEPLDRLLRLDGKDEFAIYVAPVCKVR